MSSSPTPPSFASRYNHDFHLRSRILMLRLFWSSFLQRSFVRDFCLLSATLKTSAFDSCQFHLCKLLSEQLLPELSISLNVVLHPESSSEPSGVSFDKLSCILTPEISLDTFLEKDGYAFLDLVDSLANSFPCSPERHESERERCHQAALFLRSNLDIAPQLVFVRKILLLAFVEYMIDGYVSLTQECSLPNLLGMFRKCNTCRGAPQIFCDACEDMCYCDYRCLRRDWRDHSQSCKGDLKNWTLFEDLRFGGAWSEDPEEREATPPKKAPGLKSEGTPIEFSEETAVAIRDKFFGVVRKRKQDVLGHLDTISTLLSESWSQHDQQEVLNFGAILLGSLEILRVQLKAVLKDFVPRSQHSLNTLVQSLPPAVASVKNAALQLHDLVVKLLAYFTKLKQLSPKYSKSGPLYENDRLRKDWTSLSKDLETLLRQDGRI